MLINSLFDFGPAQAGFVVAAVLLMLLEALHAYRRKRASYGITWWLMGGVAVLNLLVLCYFWINHIGINRQPTGAEQQLVTHMQHIMLGEPIYTTSFAGAPPTYNPFYYLLSLPFALLFGANATTLRLVSVLGVIGSGLVLFRLVSEQTQTRWWGLVALGLFASTLGMMDGYLGVASPEPWMLCCVLLGTYLISQNTSTQTNLLGLILLINAFWFRQMGIFFVLGGLGYLAWRHGWRQAWPYYLLASVFLLFTWLFVAPQIFGENYHLLTGAVARQELSFSPTGLLRFGIGAYPILAIAGMVLIGYMTWKERRYLAVWHVQMIAALLVGTVGVHATSTPDQALVVTNVWFILVGLMALFRLTKQIEITRHLQVHVAALFASFAVALKS